MGTPESGKVQNKTSNPTNRRYRIHLVKGSPQDGVVENIGAKVEESPAKEQVHNVELQVVRVNWRDQDILTT